MNLGRKWRSVERERMKQTAKHFEVGNMLFFEDSKAMANPLFNQVPRASGGVDPSPLVDLIHARNTKELVSELTPIFVIMEN